jgi:hypothetical protein
MVVVAAFRPVQATINMIEALDGLISLVGQVPEFVRGGDTSEGRVLRLEDKVKAHDDRFHYLTNELAASTVAIASQLTGERDARMQADQPTREKLEAFSVGGIYIEMAGLLWLASGIIFATIPQELAMLLR